MEPIALGESAGAEQHTLDIQEMASHTHVMTGSSNAPDRPSPAGNYWATQPQNDYAGSPDGPMSTAGTVDAGGGQSHENRSPLMAVNFCICVRGPIPSKPETDPGS
jgi:microcystin-dependent protein